MYYRVLLPTACGGFDVSIKSDFLAERYIFILCDCVRTNLRNKRTIVSFDCLPVHELKKQRSVCPWDEKPQALSACFLLKNSGNTTKLFLGI